MRARAAKEKGRGGVGQGGGNEGDFELMAVIYMGVQRRVCGLQSECVWGGKNCTERNDWLERR